MAEIVGTAIGVVAAILQTIRTLHNASLTTNTARHRIAGVKSLLHQVGQAVEAAQSRHGSRLHNDRLLERILELGHVHDTFLPQLEILERETNSRKLRRFWSCCWMAATGADEIDAISAALEGRLEAWLARQSLSSRLGEAIDSYAQGFPSCLGFHPSDGYQPLLAKVHDVCQLLEHSHNKAVLIHGLSGIGKSSLAHFVLSNSLPNRFSHGPLKLFLGYGCSRKAVGYDVYEYHKILSGKIMHLLRSQLGYQSDNTEVIDLERSSHLLEERLRGKKYLVLLDDLWDQDVLIRFMRFRGNACKFLVTSRVHSIAGRDADKVELCKEDVKHVGKAILQYQSQIHTLPDVADELLERCGFHPLTLAVLGQALEHETRPEQWHKALYNLHIYADKYLPETYLLEDAGNTATVFGSLEFSLKAMEQNARDLFLSFAVLAWCEPIPEACLEALWCILEQPSTFRIEISSLVKASLVGRHKILYTYVLHDMVALYLDSKFEDALRLFKFRDPEKCAAVSPWIYRYGTPRSRQMAEETLTWVLQQAGKEMLQGQVFAAISAVCHVDNACRDFHKFVMAQIPSLFSRDVSTKETPEAMMRFMAAFFSDEDWECVSKQLVDAGALWKLREFLLDGNTLSSAIKVLEKTMEFLMSSLEEVLRMDLPLEELVAVLHPDQHSAHTLTYTSCQSRKRNCSYVFVCSSPW